MRAIQITEFGGPEVLQLPENVEKYPLSEAARAHEDMQEHRTHGKLLLGPSS